MFRSQLTVSLILLGSVLLLSSSPASAADPGWPRQIDAPQAMIVLYQPQPETFQGDILTARAAVAVTPKGTTNPLYGTVWTSARVETDRDQRSVTIVDLTVTRAMFPNASAQEQQMLSGILQTEVPKWNLTISLDRLEASLLNAQVVQASAAGLRTTPPRILFADEPSILVTIDGAPELRPIEKSHLQRVVNTPFPLIYDPAARTYYLNGGKLWYSAPAAEGPWLLIDNPPASVAAVVPKDQGSAATNGSGSPANTPSGPAPRIVVATEPTELIVTDGAPQYAPITGTDLLSVTNTESDVILDVSSQQQYVLLSGRWYRSRALDGPWSYVPPDQLPASFQMIPPASDRGSVRANVAGTDEARLAVIDAQIPQTATIPRGKARLKVVYDGPPQFEPIGGTTIEYAVNTGSSVLKIGRNYYACEEGVWYVSASPTGSWTVATAVPPEVQTIPPSCPLYNTRFVYVYESTPSVVYVGYTPGYFCSYPFDGVVVWGTGFSYRPWLGAYFFPRPLTWGFDVSYHSWGGWTFGLSDYSGPFFLAFDWERWWGPGRRIDINNPRFRGAGRGDNLYDRRGGIARDLQARRSPRAVASRVAPGGANNVFAHPNGEIYRRTGNGWEAHRPNGWAPSRPEEFGRPVAGENRGLPAPGGRGTASAPAPYVYPHPLEPDYRAREMGRSLEGGFRSQGFAGRPGGGFGGRPGGFGGGPRAGFGGRGGRR